MARAKSNGDGRLSETLATLNQTMANLNQAMAALAQNQAAFLARMTATDAQIAQANSINSERFIRIEAILMEPQPHLAGVAGRHPRQDRLQVPNRKRQSDSASLLARKMNMA